MNIIIDSKLRNSKKSHGIFGDNTKNSSITKQSHPESKQPVSSKAFEYKENKKEDKKPLQQTFGGWDVPEDDFDASNNSDMHINNDMKIANVNSAWDNKPINKVAPRVMTKQKTSGIDYGNLDESDDSESDKVSEDNDDWDF